LFFFLGSIIIIAAAHIILLPQNPAVTEGADIARQLFDNNADIPLAYTDAQLLRLEIVNIANSLSIMQSDPGFLTLDIYALLGTLEAIENAILFKQHSLLLLSRTSFAVDNTDFMYTELLNTCYDGMTWHHSSLIKFEIIVNDMQNYINHLNYRYQSILTKQILWKR
jgi:hypothetical protein